jgi:hypothetical protein
MCPDWFPSDVAEMPQVNTRSVRLCTPPSLSLVEGTVQVACEEETYPELPVSDVADMPQVSTRFVRLIDRRYRLLSALFRSLVRKRRKFTVSLAPRCWRMCGN